jgi:hypothetical protein
MTAGTLTSPNPEKSGEETTQYKLCEICVGGGGAGGPSCIFGGLSISQVRPSQRPDEERSPRRRGGW